MPNARLILLGPPRLESPTPPAPLTSRKGLALLGYLALTNRPHTRETLAELLWPYRPRQDALTNLRRTLYRVRAALPPGALEVAAGKLALRGPGLWVDAWAFRDALRAHPPEAGGSQPDRRALDDAARLCEGTLFEGFELPGCPAFEEWLSLEREAHHEALARVLERLGRASLLEGDLPAALVAGRRWSALRPYSEAAHRLIMRAHAHRGDTAAATEQYRRCRDVLASELGAGPDPATEELHRALRAGAPLPAEHATRAPAEVRYVQSGDVHIAYQIAGRGAVDLLVAPGFVSHLDHLWRYEPLRAMLARLAERFRLILFDRRGVGLSERVGAPPTLYATARDIDAVLDAAGSSQAFLFGFSEGGPAGLLYAALHPQRVRGLVLYGTMAKGLRAPDYPWAPDEPQFDAWLDTLVSRWGRPVPHEAFAPSYKDVPALWSWYAEMMRLGSSPAGMHAILDAVRQLDVRPLLSHVAAPTLLLHRSGDRVIRVGAGRYLAENLPAARYLELEGEDHWWWLGDGDAFLRPVEAFIAEAAAGQDPSGQDPSGRDRSRRDRSGSLRTVLCRRGSSGPTEAPAFAEPLAALEATAGLGGGTDAGAGERAVVHCGGSAADPEALARSLLPAARAGEVLVTDRVRDIGLSVGYAFERRDAGPADAGSRPPGLWALTGRPA